MTKTQDILTKLFIELQEAQNKLVTLSGTLKEKFLTNYEKTDSAKYNFIVAIEAMIDIGNHLIAEKKLGLPKEYGDVFRILEEKGVFSKEYTTKFVEMAKFRNLLVHIYWKVDNEKLYSILKENLEDFNIFTEAVRKYLTKEN